MKDSLHKLLEKIKKQPHQDPGFIAKAFKRLDSQVGYTRDKGELHHFCSFFVPINKSEKKIFLTHHKKANDWIPPGGHIDAGESPQESVIREYWEELGEIIQRKQISPFAFTIKEIGTPDCATHLDFWFIVNTTVTPFKTLKAEFHDANWFDFSAIEHMTKNPLDQKTLQSIIRRFN